MKTQISYTINIAGINFHISAPDKVRLNHKVKYFLIKSKRTPDSSKNVPDPNKNIPASNKKVSDSNKNKSASSKYLSASDKSILDSEKKVPDSNKSILDPDIKLSIRYEENITLDDNTISLDDHIKWSTHKDGVVKIYVMDGNRVQSCMNINNVWNNARILTNVNQKRMISQLQGVLGEIFFRNCLLQYEGIVIHAAAITCDNKGIIFSAPSGTGKTTQAKLWKKYMGAKIINADRPAIRTIEEVTYIYGTLWNGTSKEYTNARVRLHMIVMVEQSPTNEIIRLIGKEAVAKVMPRCFLPYCTHEIMDLALKNIEKIIGKTPVYLLKCRPDKEAVELVNQCLE